MSEPATTPSRRGLIAAAAAAVVVAAIGIAVFVGLNPFAKGQMPTYAAAAPANAPFFIEISVPGGNFFDVAMLLNSRLLSDVGRESVRKTWDDLTENLESDPTVRAELDAMKEVRRIAVLPLSPSFDGAAFYEYLVSSAKGWAIDEEEYDNPFAVIFEFATADARDTIMKSAADGWMRAHSLDHGGKALLIGTSGADDAAYDLLVERLRDPLAESLATSEAMRQAVAVNRTYGLFMYMDYEFAWSFSEESNREIAEDFGWYAATDDADRWQAAMRQLFAPAEIGPIGTWIGLDEMETMYTVGDWPPYRTGLFRPSDESMIAKLPATTGAFMKAGLFESSLRNALRQLEARAPLMWELLREETRYSEPEAQWDAIQQWMSQTGDALTGQVAIGVATVADRPMIVMAFGVRDRSAIGASLQDLLKMVFAPDEAKQHERVLEESVEYQGATVYFADTPIAFVVDDDAAVLLFEPNQAIDSYGYDWDEHDIHPEVETRNTEAQNVGDVMYEAVKSFLGELADRETPLPSSRLRLTDAVPGWDQNLMSVLGLSPEALAGHRYVESNGVSVRFFEARDGEKLFEIHVRVPRLPGSQDFDAVPGGKYITSSDGFGWFEEDSTFPSVSVQGMTIVADYYAALESGNLRDAGDAREKYRGVDRTGSFVVGINSKRLFDMFGGFLGASEPYADEWISASSSFDGTVERQRVNVGIADVISLVGAIGGAIIPHLIGSSEPVDRPVPAVDPKWHEARDLATTVVAAIAVYNAADRAAKDLPYGTYALTDVVTDDGRTAMDVLGLIERDLATEFLQYFHIDDIFIEFVPNEFGGRPVFAVSINGGRYPDSPIGHLTSSMYGGWAVHTEPFEPFEPLEDEWQLPEPPVGRARLTEEERTRRLIDELLPAMNEYSNMHPRGMFPPDQGEEPWNTASLVLTLRNFDLYEFRDSLMPNIDGNLELVDGWGRPFRYRAWRGRADTEGARNPHTFDLWSAGEDGIFGTADDIGNWASPVDEEQEDAAEPDDEGDAGDE